MAKIIQLKDPWGEDVYPIVQGAGHQIFDEYNVPTDGVTDAAAALQDVFDNCGAVLSFRPGVYVLSGSLILDPSKIKVLEGNGAVLKITTDVPALIVRGSGSSSFTADPTTLTDKQKQNEASTIVRNLKVTSSNSSTGTGIQIEQCWQPVIRNCYCWAIKNGIVVHGRNRNVIIDGNNIYQCSGYGLLYDAGSNVHQSNIYGNHISYCQNCVAFVQTGETANVQLVGNDIEIATWPTANRTAQRCIVIDYRATSLFSEIEIVGNTIQGHEYSNGLIDISGVSDGPIENVSIGSNQISNVNGYAIKMTNVHNVALANNTYRRVSGKVVQLAGTISGLVMTGEVAENGTGFVNSDTNAALYAVTLSALTGRGLTGGVTLSCATINGLSISGCNIASSDVTVAASTIDYVSIVGNNLRGTYSIANCAHRLVENNI